MVAEPASQASASVHKMTFAVADVAATDQLLREAPYQKVVEQNLQRMIEACPSKTGALISSYGDHAFLNTVYYAYSFHHPLVFSPDHIWLLICQGFAQHVSLNAETFRHHFVAHEGKADLSVRRDDFLKGAKNNDWEAIFPEFTQKIQAQLNGDFYDLLIPGFSTTTEVEKKAFEITFMDTFKSYFEYTVYSWCGIPSVTLEGTPADWQSIVERTRRLSDYDLAWWVESLLPVLEEFVRASEGNPNRDFWARIYDEKKSSGGATITGWILRFFPYLMVGNMPKLNNLLKPDADLMNTTTQRSFKMHHAGSGISYTPFQWQCLQTAYQMEFVAGFMGITQDHDTKALRPEIGWAVCEALGSK